jgi:hypothetical protein
MVVVELLQRDEGRGVGVSLVDSLLNIYFPPYPPQIHTDIVVIYMRVMRKLWRSF